LLPDGSFSYEPAFFSPEPVVFRYRICYDECPDYCGEGTVVINLEFDDQECLVSPVLTPNGDDRNDWLVISCIQEGDRDNELIIFNQWGDEVFRAAPYLNNSVDGWRGTWEGNPLPGGTYYYLFRRSPGAEPLKGYVTIFRK
jgi:gliding motility-associated-like protein